MQQKYLLQGLACAHCASTIEREVQGWQDVASASLDLMSGKLVVETTTEAAAFLQRLTACVAKVEKKVKVVALQPSAAANHATHGSCDCGHDHAAHGSCDCGHDHDPAAHGSSCDCGHDHAAHGSNCDCGHDHDHAAHGSSCDCGHDHDHAAYGSSCDCGHDHDHAAHGSSCDCGHDHDPVARGSSCDCGHDHDHAAPSGQGAAAGGRQKFSLSGLSCAHCAATIEHEIQGWPEVRAANLDLMKGVLSIDSTLADDVLLARVRDCANRVEKGVGVTPFEAVAAPKTVKKQASGWRTLIETSPREVAAFVASLALLVAAEFLADASAPLSLASYMLAYLIVGLPVLAQAAKAARGGFVFNEQMLMGVASLGAMAVGEYAEGVAVMLFYTLGEVLQELAVNRSKRSIASLLDLRPDTVRVQTADGWADMAPEAVAVGQMIQIQPGERIALDGTVVSGSARLDTSAVTGESKPFDVAAGDSVQSGSVNADGVLVIRVDKAYGDSTLSRILALVEDASARKAHAEKFITRFARYYTPVVVGLAAMVALLPPLVAGGDWSTWIYRGLVFLVVSCPCALVISVPLTYFAGIGGASRQHILVKGSQFLETLAQIKQVAFDKTGTLTRGEFHVAKVVPQADWNEEQVLQVAAALEQYAAHPLAEAIVKAAGRAPAAVSDYQNIAGQGISARLAGETYFIGNARLLESQGILLDKKQLPQGTTVLLADSQRLLGIILLEDTPKDGVREAIAELRHAGVEKSVMLSGDHPQVAQRLAEQLGMDDVHGGLLPQDKICCVEEMMQGAGGKLAFVGDGINDAPVLARADVGIAMGGVGSDAAIEAADVVLMSDHPRDVVKAIKIARKTRTIAFENVIGALAFKGLLLVLATLGLANMWMAVFADVGVCIICVINAMRAMATVK